MPGRPVLPVVLSAEERHELQLRADGCAGLAYESERAKIILYRAEGLSQVQTAERIGCSVRRVSYWVSRFRRKGILGLAEKSVRDGVVKKTRKNIGPVDAVRLRKVSVGPDRIGKERKLRTPEDKAVASLRSVAKEAGVSPMTASRVLRGVKNVDSAMKKCVLEAAGNQGYRCDMQLKKLMGHLHQRQKKKLQGSICVLTSDDWTPGSDAYYRRVLAGAQKCTEKLHLDWAEASYLELIQYPKRVMRMLRSRGIEGILLPPAKERLLLPAVEIWDHFSVMVASYCFVVKSFHRVVPNHFRNMQLICESLWAEGRRKIGLVIAHSLDERTQYHMSGAFAAFHFQNRAPMIPCFIYNDKLDRELSDWYASERPDAIIAGSSWAAKQISEYLKIGIRGPVTFAVASQLDFSESPAGGIDELPEQVGAIAIERLARMIIAQEKGLAKHPTVTMVDGVWHNGRSP